MVGDGTGGIAALGRILTKHRSEVAYDLRALCGVGLWSVRVPELWLLIQGLLKDTRSWLFAVVNDWDYPVSREWLLAADQFDLFVRANTPKNKQRQVKPHPRPFSTDKRYGGRKKNTKRRTPEEVKALFGRT
jgi:hypothetical protein